MSPLSLILALCVLLPSPARAQQAPDPARARALLERLDASVRSPKDSYAGEARRPIAAILGELRAETAKLQPPSGQAEALVAFQRAVEQRLGPQDALWTGASLKLGSDQLTAAFSRLFPAAAPGRASFSGREPPVVRAVPASVAVAAKGGRGAVSDPRLFYDGGSARGGAPAAAAGGPAPKFVYTGPARVHPSDLALPPVPAPYTHVAAGVGDAFKEQFGTVKGVVSLLAFTALGLLLSALSGGVGLVVTIIKALCGLAVLWMAGSLIARLVSAFKDLATTKPNDPRRARALREIGKVGGELLIVVLMAFAGVKIGQKAPVKNAVGAMTKALQGQMARIGVRPAAAAAATAPKFAVEPNKWNYFFGKIKSVVKQGMTQKEIAKQKHNLDRSKQIARVLEENGIKDDAAGRQRLTALFDRAMSAPSIRHVETPFGANVIKAAEVPTATLEVAFFYPRDAKGVVDFSKTPVVTTVIPKEH